jgi:alpha-ribazole phosphatase
VCVWTSPRARCLAPARRVAQALQLPLRIDEGLREISLGEWQLRRWDDIAAVDGERLRAWMDDWQTQSPPGGECPAQLLQRVSAWWGDLEGGDHLLISHAGVHRALRVLLGGSSWSEAMGGEVPHLTGEWFGIG